MCKAKEVHAYTRFMPVGQDSLMCTRPGMAIQAVYVVLSFEIDEHGIVSSNLPLMGKESCVQTAPTDRF